MPSFEHKSLSFVVILINCLAPLLAYAQPSPDDGDSCDVAVQAVTAIPTLNDARVLDEGQEAKLRSFLQGAGKQLDEIDIERSSLRMLDEQVSRVPVGESVEFKLQSSDTSKQSLQVSLADVDFQQVHLGLQWYSSDGVELLSTRMGVPSGRFVLIGAESEPRGATLLLVKVVCDSL